MLTLRCCPLVIEQQFRQPGPNMKPRNPGKSIKFDSDYDFEQANNKFEELRTQLAKLKVADGAAPDVKIEPQVSDIVNSRRI